MNVVKQGYSLRFFMDKLSSQLNAQYIGCSTGDVVVNHMLYADDVPLFTPRSMMIGSDQLNFVSNYTYIGHIICDDLSDESDMKAKARQMYARSNMLGQRFQSKV